VSVFAFLALPLEIRKKVYGHFGNLEWSIDASIDNWGGWPELSDNSSSETCNNRKILGICRQITDEYLNEFFRVLPTTICLRGFMSNQILIARDRFDRLRMLIDSLTSSIVSGQQATPKSIERSSPGSVGNNQNPSDSICRNIHRVRHFRIKIVLIDRFWDLSAHLEGVIHALSGIVCSRIYQEDLHTPVLLLFHNLTHISILVNIKTSTPLVRDAELKHNINQTVAQDLAALWMHGTLDVCRLSIKRLVQKGENTDEILLYQSCESRLRDENGIITEQMLDGEKLTWKWVPTSNHGRILQGPNSICRNSEEDLPVLESEFRGFTLSSSNIL
jgi:hypothetical protein